MAISSCSLANAIAEPENETVPMRTPSSTSAIWYTAGFVPSDCQCNSSTTEMTDAAPPPTPLKMATICGIAVIFTSRAAGTAIAAPSTIATRASARFFPAWWTTGLVNVIATARTAEAAPTRFPCRARFGELKPFIATMNPMMAIR